MFSLINTGTNLAEDIESGFFNRLALTPLRRVSLIAGLLVGVAALGALQSAVYILIGLIAGAHLDAGFGGALVILVLGSLTTRRRSARSAARPRCARAPAKRCRACSRCSSCSSSCPRATCRATCCRRAGFTRSRTWNPISYLIEAFRSLFIFGWDGPRCGAASPWRSACSIVALLAVAATIRGRGCSAHEQRRRTSRRASAWRVAPARSHGGAFTPTCAGPICSSPRSCFRSSSWRASPAACPRSARCPAFTSPPATRPSSSCSCCASRRCSAGCSRASRSRSTSKAASRGG